MTGCSHPPPRALRPAAHSLAHLQEETSSLRSQLRRAEDTAAAETATLKQELEQAKAEAAQAVEQARQEEKARLGDRVQVRPVLASGPSSAVPPSHTTPLCCAVCCRRWRRSWRR